MVDLIIGRLCCGKSTLSRRLCAEKGAALISCDALMQAIFPEPLGERYELYADRCKAYLYRQARDLAEKGMPVVMDFGFWRRSDRERAAEVFAGLPVTWYWVNPPEEEWRRRVEQRNAAVLAGRAPGEYLVDEGLMRKLTERFEAPTYEELPGMIVIS